MKSRLLILVMACTLVYMSIRWVKASDVKTENKEMNAAYENLMTRTSVRAYTDETIDKPTIEKLVRAGMAAPTAMNRQPWHFVVVTDKATLAGLSQANPYAGMAAKAPLAIVVCGDMHKVGDGESAQYWIQDCSAASENILLAAHALGLGAVWTGTYPGAYRCTAVSKVLRLPAHIIPLNTIVVGHPAEDVTPKDKWKPENVSYNTYGQTAEQ